MAATLRTSPDLEGPCLIIYEYPRGSTDEQIDRGLAAAQRVFADAGVDPAEAGGYSDTNDAFEKAYLDGLWEEAGRAATVACWAPREGEPEPVRLEIYV